MPPSVFEKYAARAYPYHYAGELTVTRLVGGVPSDPRIAEGYIKTKLAIKDDLIRQAVAEVMAERGIDAEEAAKVVAGQSVNGFKRDADGLYIEGRQLKAALKEGANVAMAVEKLPRKWGQTKKGIESFVAEHIGVVEDRLYLGNGNGPVHEPDGIQQRFVHTFRGSAIQYEEYAENVHLAFTIESDYPFTEEHWAMIWLTAEQQGIGASRSQGYGRFTVTKWEETPAS
jgi:hypothetical protein